MENLMKGTREREDGLFEKRFTVNGKRYSVYGHTEGELLEKAQDIEASVCCKDNGSYETRIYKTTDYSIFKKLLGNRDVDEKRVNRIMECIKRSGYVSNPIIVNEKMEVIDGQGRLEALKRLGLPVEYRIIYGLTIDHCIAMNLKSTNWNTLNFVKSNADRGNDDYKRLLALNEKYPIFSISTLRALIKMTPALGAKTTEGLREGELKLSESEYKEIDELCSYLSKFVDVQKRIKGRKEVFYASLGWVARQDGVDRERLLKTLSRADSINTSDKDHMLRGISDFYNYNYSLNKKRFFDYEYKTGNSC